MSSGDVERDIGALEARADAQDQRLARIEQKVDMLVDAVAQSKGGMRMLIAIVTAAGAIAGIVGAAISKLWPHT